MRKIRLTAVLLIAILTTSCGDSDSSSGGSGNSFTGTGSIRLFTPGVPVVEGDMNLVITLKDNTVLIETSYGPEGSAPLSGDGSSYDVPVGLSLREGSASCSGNMVFSGTISGDKTSGSISGQLPCRNGFVGYTASISGSFIAKR